MGFARLLRHLRGVGAAWPPGVARIVGAVAGVTPAAAGTVSRLHVRDHLLVCSACTSLQAAEVDCWEHSERNREKGNAAVQALSAAALVRQFDCGLICCDLRQLCSLDSWHQQQAGSECLFSPRKRECDFPWGRFQVFLTKK